MIGPMDGPIDRSMDGPMDGPTIVEDLLTKTKPKTGLANVINFDLG